MTVQISAWRKPGYCVTLTGGSSISCLCCAIQVHPRMLEREVEAPVEGGACSARAAGAATPTCPTPELTTSPKGQQLENPKYQSGADHLGQAVPDWGGTFYLCPDHQNPQTTHSENRKKMLSRVGKAVLMILSALLDRFYLENALEH